MKNLRLKKTNQLLCSGPADCRKLMLNNFPFIMARPEISETSRLPMISSMFLLTMLTLMKSSDALLRMLIQKGSNLHDNSSENFSISRGEFSHWNPRTSPACNVLGFWRVYWSGRPQENYPKASLCDSGEIFTSHWPDCRRPNLLGKVRLLVTRLEQKFSKAYTPGKNITVDESLVKFNGRLSFKQYMLMKPDKFGIASTFGFSLMLIRTTFHAFKFTWARMERTVSYFKEKVSVTMLLGLLENLTWIIISIFSLTINSHQLIWCEIWKQGTCMLAAPFALTGKTTLPAWSEWNSFAAKFEPVKVKI